jgi:uncharacterized protein (TIGR02996 family)
MTTEEAFLRGVLDDIRDPLRRLAFADWLDDHGDPRAEWLRLDCELAGLDQWDGRRPMLEARKRELGEALRECLVDWERRFALARIKDKVRRAPESHPLYDARATHRGRLHRPLGEDELAAFEREHRVTLPEEYRAFLRDVGNGGLGPGYGLSPLVGGDYTGAAEGGLDKPFPFTFRTWNGEEDFTDQPGVLYLATPDEPWASVYLVVTGEDRGLVWGFGHCGGGWFPQSPICGDDQAATVEDLPRRFLRWYEDWLDRLLPAEPAGGSESAAGTG